MKDYSLRNEKSRLIRELATSLHEHITELFDNGYDQGYADAKSELGQNAIDLAHEENDRAYQQGLEDAWEFIKKIAENENVGGYSSKMLQNIFGTMFVDNIVLKFTAQEAISKIKEYEEQQKQDTEIQVGDMVVIENDTKAVVLDIDEDGCYWILDESGQAMTFSDDEISKTNRHFSQIAEVLAEMRGDSE